MNRYHIIDLKNDERKIIVSTSYVNPLSQILLIAKDLEGKGYKGEIIFDLLLSNGFSKNRFLITSFDGKNIDISSLLATDTIEEKILEEIYLFMQTHPEYVQLSILADSQKYILMNGLA